MVGTQQVLLPARLLMSPCVCRVGLESRVLAFGETSVSQPWMPARRVGGEWVEAHGSLLIGVPGRTRRGGRLRTEGPAAGVEGR